MPLNSGVGPDIELLATEIGFIDNLIEILDQIDWSSPAPAGLVRKISLRIDALKPYLSPWMKAFLDCRGIRLDYLANLELAELPWLAMFDEGIRSDRTEFLDWSAPVNLAMRMLLEFGRIGRLNGAAGPIIERFEWLRGVAPGDTDAERALSMALRIESDYSPRAPLSQNVFDAALELGIP